MGAVQVGGESWGKVLILHESEHPPVFIPAVTRQSCRKPRLRTKRQPGRDRDQSPHRAARGQELSLTPCRMLEHGRTAAAQIAKSTVPG